MTRLPRCPVGRLARRAVRAAFEPSIAEPASPAFRYHLSLTLVGQIADQLARIHVVHDGAQRHPHLEIAARLARHIAAGTALSALCPELSRHAKSGQRVERRVGNEIDAAAIATIPAVRTTLGHVLLSAEAQAAVSAVAGDDANCCLIDEFHALNSNTKNPADAGFFQNNRWSGYSREREGTLFRPEGPLERLSSLRHSRTVASSGPSSRT